MAGAAIALMAGSTVLNMVNAYQQGKAQKKALNRQAEIDGQNAASTALQTSINSDALRSQKRAELAEQRAAMGQAGLDGGTAEGIYMQGFKNTLQDAASYDYNGLTQWANYKNQAALNRYNAKQAFKAGQYGMITGGISGAAKTLAFAGNAYGWWGGKGGGK